MYMNLRTDEVPGRKRSASALRGTVLSLIATVIAVFALQSPSMADEDWYSACGNSWVTCQTGVKVGIGEGECMTANASNKYTSVCVRYDNDYVYVRDGEADGYAAIAEISYANVDTKNIRLCRNNYGYGTWARCDFDWTEGVTKEVWAGYKVSYDVVWTGDYLWSFSGK
jgi:hypothetical protein